MKFSNIYYITEKLDSIGLTKLADRIENIIMKYSQEEENLYDDEEILQQGELEALQEASRLQQQKQLLERQKLQIRKPIVKNSLEDLAIMNEMNKLNPAQINTIQQNQKQVAI